MVIVLCECALASIIVIRILVVVYLVIIVSCFDDCNANSYDCVCSFLCEYFDNCNANSCGFVFIFCVSVLLLR